MLRVNQYPIGWEVTATHRASESHLTFARVTVHIFYPCMNHITSYILLFKRSLKKAYPFLFTYIIGKSPGPQNKNKFLWGPSPGISYKQWGLNGIAGQRWNTTTRDGNAKWFLFRWEQSRCCIAHLPLAGPSDRQVCNIAYPLSRCRSSRGKICNIADLPPFL